MRFVPISSDQRERMLRVIGVESAEELFADVPASVHLDRPLALGEPMSELELVSHLDALARANTPASQLVSFAGAGCYDHYVPSIVDHVLRKPEFFTAYTPYQPEVSQGTLQAFFEYQTMICELTGMEVSNASMYDGATAFVEAALMACRLTKRHTVAVARTVHPEWLATLETYAASGLFEIEYVSGEGLTAEDEWRAVADEHVAAFLVASPNYWGALEDVEAIAPLAHEAGGLAVVATNPVLLGVMEPPSSAGADIVVGEGQPLGNPMSFGGPGLGFLSCRMQFVRQMPGRLVGATLDADGNEAYVLTLSTREQHIRREKATSNICSNHALNALAAAVYLASVGTDGLVDVARVCLNRAHYMRDRLLETGRFSAPWDAPFGYEFALVYDGNVRAMHEEMRSRGYLAGVIAEDAGSGGTDLVVFAVTEKRTRAQIDAFIEEVAAL